MNKIFSINKFPKNAPYCNDIIFTNLSKNYHYNLWYRVKSTSDQITNNFPQPISRVIRVSSLIGFLARRLMKSLGPQRTRKELYCGWKWCCPRGQSSVRCARVKGTLTIPWNVSQPIRAWNSLTSSRNSYTLSRWRAPIDIQRSNFVSWFASFYEFRFARFTDSPSQLSHSAVPIFKKRKNKERNKRLKT